MSNTPQKKKRTLTLTDLILYALAVFMLFRVPWNNMNSFHYMLFFLFILCLMLRFSNMRKAAMREIALQRKKEAEEAAAKAQQTALLTDDVQETSAEAPTEAVEIAEPTDTPTDAPAEAVEITEPADAPAEAVEISEPEEKTTI